MQVLQPREFLDLWECGRGQHPVDRALTLLSAVHPEATRRELAEWCLGARDAGLLALYRHHFGGALEAAGSCPACSEDVDVQVSIADLLGTRQSVSVPEDEVAVGGRTIRVRAPNSFDVAAIADLAEFGQARAELLRRCVVDEAADLSEVDFEVLESAIEAADPLAEIRLQLECPACGCCWEEVVDVTAFVWARVAARAERLLWQVDRLATAYGWTEELVLALSPARRQWYVEAVG